MLMIKPEWIRAQLDNGNGTRAGLADAMGVGRDIVSKILSGKRQIKITEIPRIAKYFGVDGSGEAALSDLSPADPESDSWHRLMGLLSQLSDAELDYLTVAAEGLHARRTKAGKQ